MGDAAGEGRPEQTLPPNHSEVEMRLSAASYLDDDGLAEPTSRNRGRERVQPTMYDVD